MKKGFTLVEVLVVIVIISLISGIGVVGYRAFFKTGEEKYFDALENDLLLAGNDYFTDHRDLLPSGNNIYEAVYSDLINNKYIEDVKDTKGNNCTKASVFVYRENNKYKYEACLVCDGFKSSGKYCNGEGANNITISAVIKDTQTDYPVQKSYNSVPYLKQGQKARVTFSMANDRVRYYEAVNTSSTGVTKNCSTTNNSCYVDIDTSGTYKVTAYDSANASKRNVIATDQYFSVRISKNGPQFTIAGEDRTTMSLEESSCNGDINSEPKKEVTYTVVKANINEEYEKVEYKIKDYNRNTETSYKENTNSNKLVIKEQLPSGRYQLTVKVSNFAKGNTGSSGDEYTEESKDFEVSYYLNTTFSDGNYADLDNKHEVVYGENYDHVKELPTQKTAYGRLLDIRWHLDTEEYSDDKRIVGTNMITGSCTYGIEGLMSIPVDVPSNPESFCTTPTYNGSKQKITSDPPTNITFLNNEQKNAGTYTISMHINSPDYIWRDDWTFDDKTFECSMNRRTLYVNADDKTKYHTQPNPTLTQTYSGQVSGETPGFSNSLHTDAEDNSPVGDYDIDRGTLRLANGQGGFRASNYTMSFTGATLTILDPCDHIAYVDGDSCTSEYTCKKGTKNRLAYSSISGLESYRCSGKDEASGGSECTGSSDCCASNTITYSDGSSCSSGYSCVKGSKNRLAYSTINTTTRCPSYDKPSGGAECKGSGNCCASNIQRSDSPSCGDYSCSCSTNTYVRTCTHQYYSSLNTNTFCETGSSYSQNSGTACTPVGCGNSSVTCSTDKSGGAPHNITPCASCSHCSVYAVYLERGTGHNKRLEPIQNGITSQSGQYYCLVNPDPGWDAPANMVSSTGNNGTLTITGVPCRIYDN